MKSSSSYHPNKMKPRTFEPLVNSKIAYIKGFFKENLPPLFSPTDRERKREGRF